MKHHPERKRMRMEGYDYSRPGAYFVTACTRDRELLFESSEAQMAVESAWLTLPDIFADIELDEFVVMPNHIHCIVCIRNHGCYRLHPGTWKIDGICRDGWPPIPTNANMKYETLSNIIGAFKTSAATRVNKLRGVMGVSVWQKSFYDRIIRNNFEMDRIQEYIRNNPIKWAQDRDNPTIPAFRTPVKSIDDYWNEIFDAHV
jgi:REP element-mobilizing transposase RayT